MNDGPTWPARRSSRSSRRPRDCFARLTAQQAEALAEKLSTGTWTHDYPIWATATQELGLNVNTEMPESVLGLMKLYPQPVRTQRGGGVEYLPIPRQKGQLGRDAGA